MDSMTPDELDKGTTIVEESRLKRIAKGSGTRVEEVKILLEEYKKLKGLITKVGQTNLGKGMGDKNNLMRNSGQIMGKLQNMIDPKMMAQLGGAGNVMNMMKEMTSNPDMAKMMGDMNLEGMAKKKHVKVKK